MRRVWGIPGALLAVLWVAPLGAQQSTGTIRGRVSDAASQQPLAGVTVTFAGRGTLSQSDGHYTITGARVGTDSVRARLIGYAPAAQPVTVAGGDTVVVDLTVSAQAVGLASVVVIGYGEQRAGNITGAAAAVSDSQFNTGRVISPQSLIANKVAGVQVIDNNQPGGGLSIRVRGQASINAGSEPLYVVDGVPLGTGSGGGLSAGNDPLNFLNPNDISSMTVLKDAASAAIYGANASNGVVLITTKSGQGRPRVQYTASMSAEQMTRYNRMLDATQFRTAVATYAPAYTSLLGVANHNWIWPVVHTGYGQQHDLALSGGGASNAYRFSFGYLDQNGVLLNSSTQRISLGVNYDQRLNNDRLDIRATLKGSRAYDRFTPNGVLYNAAQMGPTQPIYDSTSVTGYYNWPGNSLTSADNPLEVLNNSTDHGTTYRSVGNVQVKYDFSSLPHLRGLTGNVNLGYDVTSAEHVTFYANNIHYETKNGTNGLYSSSTPNQSNTLLDMYLDYAPPVSLGPGNLMVTAGYSYSQSNANFPGITATYLYTNLLGDNGLPQAKTVTPFAPNVQESKLISFFGRVGYNVSDRYLASVSMRRDGSSRFAPGNQWANFPAVSVGWRISREPFMSRMPALSDLKLRASWGKTGNQAFGNYLQYSTFQLCNQQAQVQFGTEFVCPFRPSAVDPNIKWEATSTWDVGVDYDLLNGRLSGSIDWYTKRTDDLIFTIPVPAGSNLSNFVTTNLGSMRNSGFELGLNAALINHGPGGLTWTAALNASTNANKLLSINPNAGSAQVLNVGGIAGGVGSTIQVLQPGQPINSFFVCKQVYGANGKPVEGSYYNLAGDSVVTGCTLNSNTRAFHNPVPKWMLGLSSSLSYHRVDLSFTLRAWIGNYVYNNVASNLGNYKQLTAGSAPYNLSTSVLATGFVNQQLLSDYYIESGSFLRLDNVTLGYAFPWQGQDLRVFTTIQNAFTITGYSGVDPTAGVNGVDNNIYPRSRIFTSGLSVQF